MKLSTKTTYGLRALAVLARLFPEGLSVADLANQEKMSVKYLETILSSLKKQSILSSTKGSAGGYSLARNPKEINLWQVVEVLEGGLAVAHCVGNRGKVFCGDHCDCRVGQILSEIEVVWASLLQKRTLAELVSTKN
ncbi:transcriptional regulator [Candidatus Falkowbacteria bacterium CG10_big_fil_rev_8_21_14_0_10_37_14]|uniref:Transcriptional regulator n=1 Tax=Candidatus Falkowbacteria bacterium CG10_big_fil_rev_8_21_14_0_10_37_14 TaxID=1974561 RepID=A0A2M6WSJ0_9BACT|nr:Rrf2 family transcriptional regulator [Candidatus Falkowbacteria bacterium]PIT95780.1 MAG: transcriptional regulator [Candidatus Falkowbacteria bacterium CG10_big_fil_rev_8_21_14_0_10_37_14]